jgi:hypothetical protein
MKGLDDQCANIEQTGQATSLRVCLVDRATSKLLSLLRQADFNMLS